MIKKQIRIYRNGKLYSVTAEVGYGNSVGTYTISPLKLAPESIPDEEQLGPELAAAYVPSQDAWDMSELDSLFQEYENWEPPNDN
jgi:hypothetical protein